MPTMRLPNQAPPVPPVIAHIREEHQRWERRIVDDPYIGRTTIGIKEVLLAHFLLAEYFAATGEGLGGLGPRNMDLLHSALYRQKAEFGGTIKWRDPIDNCASLMYGLIQNHPFHDANKRTAFLTALLHLQKLGRTPTVEGQMFEDFTVAIANHELSNHEYYSMFSGLPVDKEIQTISRFLIRNSREIDIRHKQITYNHLLSILTPHGLTLQHPIGNRIDLVRIKEEDGRLLPKPKRLAKIGFKSWTTQISPKDLSIVRESSGMGRQQGYDSRSFFDGLATPLQLINKYSEPLRRLAFR